MSSHLLLDKIFEYPIKNKEDSTRHCIYDNLTGYWKHDNKIMIMDKKFPKPTTKKHDVETGEDLKGE